MLLGRSMQNLRLQPLVRPEWIVAPCVFVRQAAASAPVCTTGAVRTSRTGLRTDTQAGPQTVRTTAGEY